MKCIEAVTADRAAVAAYMLAASKVLLGVIKPMAFTLACLGGIDFCK